MSFSSCFGTVFLASTVLGATGSATGAAATAFSSEYALKDLSYAINLGKTHNLNLPGANSAKKLLKKSIMNGDKDLYFPVIKKHFG